MSRETLSEWFPECFPNSLWVLSWVEIASSGESYLTHLGAPSPKWRDSIPLLHLHKLSFLFTFFLCLLFHSIIILFPCLFLLLFFSLYLLLIFLLLSCSSSFIILIVFFSLLFWREPSHLLNHLIKSCSVAIFNEFHLSLLIKIIIQVKILKTCPILKSNQITKGGKAIS